MNFLLSSYALIFSLLYDNCSSAVITTFGGPGELEDFYNEAWTKHQFSMQLISYSEKFKEKVCEDILRSDFFKNQRILYARKTDEDTINLIKRIGEERDTNLIPLYYKILRNGKEVPYYPITYPTLKFTEGTHTGESVPEMAFTCLATETGPDGETNLKELFISYAFMTKSYFVSESAGDNEIQLRAFAELSPKCTTWGSNDLLEQQYVTVRRTIEQLRAENSGIVANVELGDGLTQVRGDEIRRMCESVFEADHYKNQNVKFVHVDPSPDQYIVFDVKFKNPDYSGIKWQHDYRVCWALVRGVRMPYYITRSYNEDGSVYVHKREAPGFFLDVYVTGIPVLLNINLDSIRRTMLRRKP